jgi:riboflavin synthase
MFTGIVEAVATVAEILPEGSNIHFVMESALAGELKVNQSVAHNGVCLTVVEINGNTYKVTAVAETLAKTTLGSWLKGNEINIERALKMGDRLDGHFVQGHVDATATCKEKETMEGSWLFRIRFQKKHAALVIEKGSVCVNGVSLTAFNIKKDEFTVSIIPYTYANTNFHTIEKGSSLNIEFDMLGKYLLRREELNTRKKK